MQQHQKDLKQQWTQSTAVPASTTYLSTVNASSHVLPVSSHLASSGSHLLTAPAAHTSFVQSPARHVAPSIRVTPPAHMKPSPFLHLAGASSGAVPATGATPSTLIFSPFGRLEGVAPSSDGDLRVGPPSEAAQVPPSAVGYEVPSTPGPQQMLSYNPAAGSVQPVYGAYPSQAAGMQPMVYPVAGPSQIIYDIYDVEDMVPSQQEHWRPIAFHYRSAE